MNIGRKDIARKIGVSLKTVRKHETRLGLDRLRVTMNARLHLYPERKVDRLLRSQGFEVL